MAKFVHFIRRKSLLFSHPLLITPRRTELMTGYLRLGISNCRRWRTTPRPVPRSRASPIAQSPVASRQYPVRGVLCALCPWRLCVPFRAGKGGNAKGVRRKGAGKTGEPRSTNHTDHTDHRERISLPHRLSVLPTAYLVHLTAYSVCPTAYLACPRLICSAQVQFF